ncbi:MAG TPA: aspartate racemase [Clostridiales bacterium]|nr:aspartate racemase [Clostridiales bacterium]
MVKLQANYLAQSYVGGEILKELTVGILGGMGSKATADLFSKIILNTQSQKDQDHLHIIIDCNPKVPDRVSSIEKGDNAPVKYLKEMAMNLINCKADVLVIACITAHHYITVLQRSVDIPIMNSISMVSQFIKINYPQIKKVGLLATDATLITKLYHKSLNKQGIHVISPEANDQKILMECLRAVKTEQTSISELREKVLRIVLNLQTQGVDAIVAGCTEVPLLLNMDDFSVPFIDTTDVVAKTVVRVATGMESLDIYVELVGDEYAGLLQ